MEVFLKWVRNRFTMMIDLMSLADNDDETLKLLMFNEGPSRDEFIKFLIHKLLLDIDSEPDDSNECDLEQIFVSFGILDKNDAQQFLKGSMTIQLHIIRWRFILESLIPTTTIAPPLPRCKRLISINSEKLKYFKSVINKNYLPPELIPKLQNKPLSNKNSESVEDIVKEIAKIIHKENNDFKTILNDMDNSSNCTNSECFDLISVKKEIEKYIKISNKNKVNISNCEQSNKISLQDLYELTKTKNVDLINLELKVKNISQFINAEQDLQILADSLANKLKTNI